jgi:hypothetical protein
MSFLVVDVLLWLWMSTDHGFGAAVHAHINLLG